MAVQLNIPYETLLNLIDQLPAEQKRDLLSHLLKQADDHKLTAEEKIALYHASILHHAVNEEPSVRREDWYDDEGR
ncbi:hypothetical protein MASR2M15_25310 [Anaerolineales bacterium]